VRISGDRATSYRNLLRWVVIGVVSGVAGAFAVQAVRWTLDAGVSLVEGLSPHPVVTAVLAALAAGLVVYRISPDAAGEGVPSYLYHLRHHHGRFPMVPSIAKLPAAWLAIVGGGSGGLIGPVGMFNAGVLSRVALAVGDENHANERTRTAAICGMAATVAALFHSPLAAGIFAVEIIQRANMRYRDLFPSLLSAAFATWAARTMSWQPVITIPATVPQLDWRAIPMGIAFSLLICVLAGLFVWTYAVAVRLFQRDRGPVTVKLVIGMSAAALLAALVHPGASAGAGELTQSLLRADLSAVYGRLPMQLPVALAATAVLLLRAATSMLTIGSGMSAGLAAPAMQVGILAAIATAGVLGSPDLIPLFVVIGISGMLAGAMNVPLAAAALGLELFGVSYGVSGVIASILSFQINRQQTVYDYAIAGAGHLDDE
jgi:CIC family chloride channel protein